MTTQNRTQRVPTARRAGPYNMAAILKINADPYAALAAATLATAIGDCKAGDVGACIWLIDGRGRDWLSMLLPSDVDETAFFAKLQACAPAAIQLPLMEVA